MNRLERAADATAAMIAALDGRQAEIHTAFPGIVDTYNPVLQTCTVQPAIQAQLLGPDGVAQWITLPLLLDVPVVFPSGGGYTLTFPISPGDEVLVILAERCIDAWWAYGGVQVQAELRMHDLSDGFALPGPKSKTNALANVSTDSVQLRSDDGNTFVELEGNKVNVKAPGGLHITGPVYMNGKRVDETHTHGGVAIGTNNTGGVT